MNKSLIKTNRKSLAVKTQAV